MNAFDVSISQPLLRRAFGFKIVYFILPAILLSACGGDVSGIEGAIVDNPQNANKLRQLLMIVRVTDTAGDYVAMGRIDSVKLKINGHAWDAFPSTPVDITGIRTTTRGNYTVTDQEIGYLVVAEFTITIDSLETAGEYAEYLHNRLRLSPGDYVCEIAGVHFRDNAGNHIAIRPHVYRPFTVEENVSGLYLGEIDVRIP